MNDALWRLHIGRTPNEYELAYVRDMSNAINRLMDEKIPFMLFDKSARLAHRRLLSVFSADARHTQGSIVHAWLKAGRRVRTATWRWCTTCLP